MKLGTGLPLVCHWSGAGLSLLPVLALMVRLIARVTSDPVNSSYKQVFTRGQALVDLWHLMLEREPNHLVL